MDSADIDNSSMPKQAGSLESVAAAGTAQSEALFRFLDRLGQEATRSTSADDILAITTKLTAQHLGLSNCAYADMDEDEDGFTIRGNWHAPGSPSIVGHYSLADFGRLAVQELGAGRPLVINDILKELSPDEARTFQDIGIGATVCIPLVKGGRLTALMAIHDKDPHRWSDYELAVIREVTERSWAHVERVRAQARLLESEAKFHAIANSIDQMVWSTRPDGYHDYYNERWYEYTGVPAGSTDGEEWNGVFHPDDQERAWEVWRQSLETGEPYQIEYRLRHRSGAYRWVIGRAQCARDEAGRITRWFGTCTDIDDLKTAEQKLKVSEERYRRIFEQTSDLILTTDLDRFITDCNPSAAAAVGVSREHVIGRRTSEFISTEDFDRGTEAMRQKLESGGTTRYDVRVRSSGGEWLFWEINSGLTYGEDGTPVGLHVVGRDISDRKRFERQQQILVGELNHRVKNTLAIVQSLAHQTFAREIEGESAIASFEGRLQALASAHNLLTRMNWEAAAMSEVVTDALAPFCTDGRCKAEGPTLMLPPSTAVAMALATHELATNAAKYGALSNDHGRVLVHWSVDQGMLTFVWREEGGPPVAPVSKSGFGTRLIKRTLASELQGKAELEVRADRPGLPRRSSSAEVARGLEKLAGAAGFEPANAGTKNRCLTTWRRPNDAMNIGRDDAGERRI